MEQVSEVSEEKKEKEKKIIQDFKNKRLPFPWIRNRIDNPRELFYNLQNYVPVIVNNSFTYRYILWKTIHSNSVIPYNNKYISILTNKDDYKNIDKLVDYFNEYPRMNSCRRDKQYSPNDVWNKNPEVLEPWIQHQLKNNKSISVIGLREQLWKMGLECNAFKASLAISIYKIFNAKKILDFSSGWGDRLLAAIAYNAECYVGYDPNPHLEQGYREMIDLFVDETNRHKYEVIIEPFEMCKKIKENNYDLVFTSPPYFDFETYIPSDQLLSITQSIMNYPKLNDWIIHFLFRSLFKCWHYLIPNGNMVIHLSDVYRTHYVEAMILFVTGWCKSARIDGSIASIGDCLKPRPLWIFHKTISETYDIYSRKKMEKYYPELFVTIEKYFD